MLFVLSAKLFDALFVGEFADEQRVIVLSYDIAVESLDDHFLFLSGVDNTVMTLKHGDVRADA